jgi:hypothetical protein
MARLNLNPKTFLTSEFLAFALTNVAAWLATLVDWMSPTTATWVSAASAALYALARGLAKLNSDTKDFWNTTEFWALVLGAGITFVSGLADHIGPRGEHLLAGVLGLGLALMQFRKQPAVAAGAVPVALVVAPSDGNNALLAQSQATPPAPGGPGGGGL